MNAPPKAPAQVVFTNKARCRDCYRCLRACPVKAIRMHEGQAYVVDDRCIACGNCIRECPQGAKTFRNDVELARDLIAANPLVAASIAPSFAGQFNEWEQRRLPSALRKLGFSHVAETAIGAFSVAAATAGHIQSHTRGAHICTACPAVVRYVENYRPEMVKSLVPVVSPMLAHARHIKEKVSARAKVIFIGPCVAKKREADQASSLDLVDCVLTFSELIDWFDQAGIHLAHCEESEFDEAPAGDARLFPLPGGLARTASMGLDPFSTDILSPSGFQEINQVLESINGDESSLIIEPLFCAQGCVHGPGVARSGNPIAMRREVISYANKHKGRAPGAGVEGEDLHFVYSTNQSPWNGAFSDEQIRAVLERTGKGHPEDQLNCGACGYLNCRDKAIAVLQGMAETQMCIPRMRRLAEQQTDRIKETSPNGIVVLDERLNILSMNPAFKRMFMCSDALLGKRISYLIDPEPFERVSHGGESMVERTSCYDNYNLVCHQIVYTMSEERHLVGIFVNITSTLANEQKLEQLESETVAQAEELLEHQIDMAQQMARLLGETTARGEQLVRNLIRLASDKSTNKGNGHS